MFGVYKVSFQTSKKKAPDLGDWLVSGQFPEGKFETKNEAKNYASDCRFYDKDDRSTSRLRNLGLWSTRYYIKPCTTKGIAIIPGLKNYIESNINNEQYKTELLSIYGDSK